VANACVVIPSVNPKTVTAHAESFQALIWHLLISHPALQMSPMKWESVSRTMRQAVFLDRDGVLNGAIVRKGGPYPPASLAELKVLPGVVEACTLLRKAGFLTIVVTNQPDVSRGTQGREVVEAINQVLRKRLPLDDIRVCYHDDVDGCPCRKPEPGLLLKAAQDWNINLSASFMVGDRWKDIEAGRRAGCKTVFVDHGYTERQPDNPDHRVGSLIEAVRWILQHRAFPVGEEIG
jgi:D-glycero-D-manno-heptose 1,7-bisphosphate phosphatase